MTKRGRSRKDHFRWDERPNAPLDRSRLREFRLCGQMVEWPSGEVDIRCGGEEVTRYSELDFFKRGPTLPPIGPSRPPPQLGEVVIAAGVEMHLG